MTRVIVDLASAALGYDFWMEGRTLGKLGLKDMSLRRCLLLLIEARVLGRNRSG